jgi:hypothetical protein
MLLAHKPIQDSVIEQHIAEYLHTFDVSLLKFDNWSTDPHIDQFDQWLHSGTHCKITGLEQYPYRALCNGSSAALAQFVHKNHHRRIRVSRGEFVLGRVVATDSAISWKYLEDSPLEKNDAVIVSTPFSGNGGFYPGYTELINTCCNLNIPVCVDLAYAGIGVDIEIDVSSPCIVEVVSSLSKPFSTMLRHGIRYTRTLPDDNIQIANQSGILSRINVVIASKLMQNFSKDYIVDKYLDRYRWVCKELGLVQTNTITLALGDLEKHKEFTRGGIARICLTDELLS